MRFIIIIICVILFSNCTSDTTQIYLVPIGYEGSLILIEDSKSEQTLNIKNDTIIFDFTKSNILRINGEFIEGKTSLDRINYYYVDENGNQKIIPFSSSNSNEKDSFLVYVHIMHSQIREGSQCDLICSDKSFLKYKNEQNLICDSLFARRP